MSRQNIYVKAVAQISVQKPLCEEWMGSPILYTDPYVRASDPDFKEFVTPAESRRLGKILKRAVATSLTVVRGSGIACPDAIITGTGMGCIENTEHFLSALCNDGEQFLKPTHFMQSTHNTISSFIGIYLKCNGYNATYSHRGISFESALLDAVMQIEEGTIRNALVGSHDEMSPIYYEFMKKSGYVDGKDEICSEAAVSVMLEAGEECSGAECSSVKDSGSEALYAKGDIAKICGVELLYRPSPKCLKERLESMLCRAGMNLNDLDCIVTGIGGNNAKNERYYSDLAAVFGGSGLKKGLPLLRYKNIFGEGFSSSGLGFYAAASCLSRGFVPKEMNTGLCMTGNGIVKQNGCSCNTAIEGVKRVLLVNISEGKDYSLVLLEKVCGK